MQCLEPVTFCFTDTCNGFVSSLQSLISEYLVYFFFRSVFIPFILNYARLVNFFRYVPRWEKCLDTARARQSHRHPCQGRDPNTQSVVTSVANTNISVTGRPSGFVKISYFSVLFCVKKSIIVPCLCSYTIYYVLITICFDLSWPSSGIYSFSYIHLFLWSASPSCTEQRNTRLDEQHQTVQKTNCTSAGTQSAPPEFVTDTSS
jgi:hypothetical protein